MHSLNEGSGRYWKSFDPASETFRNFVYPTNCTTNFRSLKTGALSFMTMNGLRFDFSFESARRNSNEEQGK